MAVRHHTHSIPASPTVADPARSPAQSAGEKVRALFKSAASTERLMVGVHDYEAYVRHRQEMHPGEPVMSYEEFFKERQNSRYGVNGGKISRCC